MRLLKIEFFRKDVSHETPFFMLKRLRKTDDLRRKVVNV